MSSLRSLFVVCALGCGGGGGFPVDAGPEPEPPTGKFSLAWTVNNAANEPIACNQIGGQVITVALRNRAVQGGSTEVFTCSSLTGVSAPIAPGVYDMTFSLNGLVGELAIAPPQGGIVITSNETTALTAIAFAVDATGALELVLSSNQTGGNCGAVASMGAGITGTTIALSHAAGGACEPVTFQVSAGATQPASTYLVNCATPVEVGCIENDQKLTVSGIPSGNYKIAVRGKIGTVTCWTNDDSLVVPPLSKVLNRTLNLAKQTIAGC
ncbi:MAG: hypothetical protein ABI867_04340 [Kofleriaceae bacterium]